MKSKDIVRIIILVFLLFIFAGVIYINFFKSKPVKKEYIEAIATTGESFKVELYFSSFDGMFLVPESRGVSKSDDKNGQIKNILSELINGPKDATLFPSIPAGTNINEIYFDQQDTIYVDFSKEIRENQSGGSTSELLTVYSIVNSLTANFPEIKKVQILIDGNTVDSLAGHIDISKPIRPDTSLVQVLQKW